jgi:carbon-monoxide dehydrogenase medium subunit
MPRSPALLQPTSIEQAVESLSGYGEEARVVAGATALTIMLREGLIHPAALIDINGVEGLRAIEHVDGRLRIGALVTHREVELSPLVQSMVPVLARAFGLVANVRVRNAATAGGVLAEADYASDPPAVFLALDAEIEATGAEGARMIPAREFFVGFYETALRPGEIVTAMYVPIPATGTRAIYHKFVTRSTEDRPCVGTMAAVRMSADGKTCEDLRIAVGAAAEVPQRFLDIELRGRGTDLDEKVIGAIADGYAERVDTLSDMRGSAWYRTEMIRVWVRRAIQDVRRL